MSAEASKKWKLVFCTKYIFFSSDLGVFLYFKFYSVTDWK